MHGQLSSKTMDLNKQQQEKVKNAANLSDCVSHITAFKC